MDAGVALAFGCLTYLLLLPMTIARLDGKASNAFDRRHACSRMIATIGAWPNNAKRTSRIIDDALFNTSGKRGSDVEVIAYSTSRVETLLPLRSDIDR